LPRHLAVLRPGRHPAVTAARTPWKEALDLPGAGQVRHARALIETHEAHARVPDQSLIASEVGAGGDHVQACRAGDGAWALLYLPTGKAVTVDLSKLTGEKLSATWFDPRTGKETAAGAFAREGKREFTPPTSGKGNDWVLVLRKA
jgi:hypothetical protein